MKAHNGGNGMSDAQVVSYVRVADYFSSPCVLYFDASFFSSSAAFACSYAHAPILLNRFVDRYIPGYIFFSDGIVRGSSISGSQTDAGDSLRRPPKWIGKSLRILIGEERQYVGEEVF
jgi:hypothetical protein